MERLKFALEKRNALPFRSPPRSISPPLEDPCDSDPEDAIPFKSQVKTPKTRVIQSVRFTIIFSFASLYVSISFVWYDDKRFSFASLYVSISFVR